MEHSDRQREPAVPAGARRGLVGILAPSAGRSFRKVHEEGSRRVLGDVDPSAMAEAAYMTPVPGGVGPMTIAMVLQNTVTAARNRRASAVATAKN